MAVGGKGAKRCWKERRCGMLQACVEWGAALSSSFGRAACLACGRVTQRQPSDSFSLSEGGNTEEVANLGGRFLPVPPTLPAVGVANQAPHLAPYFSALLHLQLLFFPRTAAARSVPEAAKFSIALIWVLQNERVWGGEQI